MSGCRACRCTLPAWGRQMEGFVTFRWEGMPRRICEDIARAAGCRVTYANEDLTAKYGEPPSEQIVADLWPTLRDRWLANRPRSRESVVHSLRDEGLGDQSVRITSKAG